MSAVEIIIVNVAEHDFNYKWNKKQNKIISVCGICTSYNKNILQLNNILLCGRMNIMSLVY